jgi:hypothetical protein
MGFYCKFFVGLSILMKYIGMNENGEVRSICKFLVFCPFENSVKNDEIDRIKVKDWYWRYLFKLTNQINVIGEL